MSLFVNPPQEWSFLEETGQLVKPAANVINKQDTFIIELMAPGMNRKDFRIHVTNNRLAIDGHHKESNTQLDEQVYREFPHEEVQFYRSFELDPMVIKALYQVHYKQGILTIVFPKREHPNNRNKQLPRILKAEKEFFNDS